MRVAIYARFSSDKQTDASIVDQVRLCKKKITSEGWKLVDTYSDAAISGTLDEKDRPEYGRLLADMALDRFDVILAESLDRLSRDQEDIARLYKHSSYFGVKIVTVADGEINEMHVGLKGTMSALYIKDLAAKTHRGLEGRVVAGRSAGGRAYGYDLVKKFDVNGEPVKGQLSINPKQAKVVNRIFREFAVEGRSPNAIALRLNDDGIKPLRAKLWATSGIYVMLRNELYVGRRVWNKRRFLKNPVNGRITPRRKPQSEWVINDVPELRIILDDLWEQAQARIRETSDRTKAVRERTGSKHSRAGGGPKYLFSGILRCGICGGAFSMIDYLYGCSARNNRGPKACSNKLKVDRAIVESRLLQGIKKDLFTDEGLAMFKAEIRKLRSQRKSGRSSEVVKARKELVRVESELSNLITAMKQAKSTPAILVAEVSALEAQKIELQKVIETDPTRQLDKLDLDKLTERMAGRYQRLIEDFEITVGKDVSRARTAIKMLVGGHINVTPGKDGKLVAELHGSYESLVKLSQSPGSRRAGGTQVIGIAGACNHRELTLPAVSI